MSKKPVVLVADDEPSVRYAFKMLLEKKKYPYVLASNGEQALELFHQHKDSLKLLILDVRMPKREGLDVLSIIKRENPEIYIVIITAFGGVDTTIDAIKLGAYDFLTKPLDLKRIEKLIDSILTQKTKKTKTAQLSDEQTSKLLDELSQKDVPVIGKSLKMQEIYKIIGRVAPYDLSVLITGETGVGKELIARVIHHSSKRKNKPFIAINCTSIPAELIESELFGYEKGAFTGAIAKKSGKFELANGGTLFLDEIGDMDINLQSKLLRVLQSQEFYPVGGTKPVKVDVRIISATNKDLSKLVEAGEFRADLYHRLRVVEINIPPLRERKEDIPLLIEFFLKQSPLNPEKEEIAVSEEALKLLKSYDWPGNVRELKNVIESALAFSNGKVIDLDDIPPLLNVKESQALGKKDSSWEELFLLEVKDALKKGKFEGKLYNYFIGKVENILLGVSLEYFQNNQVKTAKYLGINRNTLRNKLQKENPKKGESEDGQKR